MGSLLRMGWQLSAVAVVAVAASAVAGASPPPCEVTESGLDALYERYHSDSVCDRGAFNRLKSSVDRRARLERLVEGDRYALVPDEATVACPAVARSLYPSPPAPVVTGFDRSWVVENKASIPVVVLWVDPQDGAEKSAFSDAVPPTADPNAIVRPGSWTVIQGYEGHVFHVREVLPDGITMGRVLLQHRLGWIPVGSTLGGKARQLVCPDGDEEPLLPIEVCDEEGWDLLEDSHGEEISLCPDGDEEPLLPIEVCDEEGWNLLEDSHGEGISLSSSASTQAQQRRLSPEFERTPYEVDRDCNRQEVGFRNVLGCPLHGYYLEAETCEPVFKFHLGIDAGYPHVLDFMDDWNSRTKFEAGLMGHTFVFRSAHTGSEVDRITLLPTTVADCPESAPAGPVRVSRPEPIGVASASVLPSGDFDLDAPLLPVLGANSSGVALTSLLGLESSSVRVMGMASRAFD
jgi:hypothetical protein